MIAGLSVLAGKLRGLFGKRNQDREFDDEMGTHLQLLRERYVRQGMTPDGADSAARRQFGNLALLREDRREMQTIRSIETLWRDVRYAARQFRLNPLFTSIAVLSLALGIGANTAVFTLLDQLVLRLLPVQEPGRLVMIWSTGPHFGSSNGQRSASYPMYQDFQRKAPAFEFVLCRFDTPSSITVDGGTERVSAELVSGNYFQALGVGPAAGRVFSPEADDQVYKGSPSVVLSHQYWLSRFGGDPKIIGKKILVNDHPMEIVGVSAAGFAGLDPASSPDIRVPIQMKPVMTPGHDDLGNRRSQWVQIFARLKPDYTVRSAQASMQPLFHQILQQEAEEPEIREISSHDRNRFLQRTALVERAATGYSALRQQYSTPLIVLLCMAGLILAIACSNVASLLIARAMARQKEMAVRLAIGAGRKALVRQLLIESVLLSLASAALGLALAVAAIHGLLSLLPASGGTLMLRAEPDARILLFSIGMALLTALLFGMAPALQATRLDVLTSLKDLVGAVTGGSSSGKLRKLLVTAQVALSFLLLMGAGLFARTLANLENTRTGFESAGNLISFQIDPAKNGYTVARTRNFYTEALREIRAAPGVKSAAYAMWPVLNGREWDLTIAVDGHQTKEGEDMQVYYNLVSPGYWQAMGVPLLRGRDFNDGRSCGRRERSTTVDGGYRQSRVCGTLLSRARPDRPAYRLLPWSRREAFYTNSGGRGKLFVWRPARRCAAASVSAVSGIGHSRSCDLLREYQKAVGSDVRDAPGHFGDAGPVNPDVRFEDSAESTGRDVEHRTSHRFPFAVFGLLATVLSALGLYGVMAFVVARRTREIGLRMALGAPRSRVLWLVMREVLILLGAGSS